jgi:hypothetical protein
MYKYIMSLLIEILHVSHPKSDSKSDRQNERNEPTSNPACTKNFITDMTSADTIQN